MTLNYRLYILMGSAHSVYSDLGSHGQFLNLRESLNAFLMANNQPKCVSF